MSRTKPRPARLSETCTVADLVLGECALLTSATIGYQDEDGSVMLTSRIRVFGERGLCRGLTHRQRWTECTHLPGEAQCTPLSEEQVEKEWGIR
jgi:hypothetical protein